MAPDGPQSEAPKLDTKSAPKAKPEQPVVAAGTEARGQKADEIAKGTVAKGEAPKAPEVAKAPDAPKPAEAPKTPDVTADNPEGLPKNEWTDSYYALLKQLTDNPEMNGPLMRFALAALRLAAKYSKYMDMIPGAFAKGVSDSDVTIEKSKADKLADEHLKFLKKTKEEKEKAEADTKKALMDLEASEKAAGRTLGAEKASIKFVTRTLWNNDDFEDSKTLCASLVNTTKFRESLYKSGTKEELVQKSPITEGTLIVFIPYPKTAEKVIAYATGVDDEFKYYDITDSANPIKTFKLRDKDSIINKPEVQTLMVLNANVQAYKDDKEVLSSEDVEKKTQESLDKVSRDNATIAKAIEENKKTPNADKLQSLKNQASFTFKEANDLYTKMLADAGKDDVNVDKLAEAEAAAKKIAESPAATDQDRSNYTEASKKTAAARKFQENLAKLKEIRDAAKKNCDDVGVDTKVPQMSTGDIAPAVQTVPATGVQASVPKIEQTPAIQAPAPAVESKDASGAEWLKSTAKATWDKLSELLFPKKK